MKDKEYTPVLTPSFLPETQLWYVLTPTGEWEIFKTQCSAENFCENYYD